MATDGPAPLRFLANTVTNYKDTAEVSPNGPKYAYDFYRSDGNFVEEFALRTRLDEAIDPADGGKAGVGGTRTRRRAILRQVLMFHQ